MNLPPKSALICTFMKNLIAIDFNDYLHQRVKKGIAGKLIEKACQIYFCRIVAHRK